MWEASRRQRRHTAKNGSDRNSCSEATSPSKAKLTVLSGVGCLKPGDVLSVRGGVYAESLVNRVPSGTSWSNAVQIRASPGETVWLRPSSDSDIVVQMNQSQQYIEFDGINMDGSNTGFGVIKIESWSGGNAHHIRVKNAEIIGSRASAQAILLTASRQGSIGGNELINLTVHGGGIYDADHGIYIESSNNLVDNCLLYDLPRRRDSGVQRVWILGEQQHDSQQHHHEPAERRQGQRRSSGRHAASISTPRIPARSRTTT